MSGPGGDYIPLPLGGTNNPFPQPDVSVLARDDGIHPIDDDGFDALMEFMGDSQRIDTEYALDRMIAEAHGLPLLVDHDDNQLSMMEMELLENEMVEQDTREADEKIDREIEALQLVDRVSEEAVEVLTTTTTRTSTAPVLLQDLERLKQKLKRKLKYARMLEREANDPTGRLKAKRMAAAKRSRDKCARRASVDGDGQETHGDVDDDEEDGPTSSRRRAPSARVRKPEDPAKAKQRWLRYRERERNDPSGARKADRLAKARLARDRRKGYTARRRVPYITSAVERPSSPTIDDGGGDIDSVLPASLEEVEGSSEEEKELPEEVLAQKLMIARGLAQHQRQVATERAEEQQGLPQANLDDMYPWSAHGRSSVASARLVGARWSHGLMDNPRGVPLDETFEVAEYGRHGSHYRITTRIPISSEEYGQALASRSFEGRPVFDAIDYAGYRHHILLVGLGTPTVEAYLRTFARQFPFPPDGRFFEPKWDVFFGDLDNKKKK